MDVHSVVFIYACDILARMFNLKLELNGCCKTVICQAFNYWFCMLMGKFHLCNNVEFYLDFWGWMLLLFVSCHLVAIFH